MSLDERAVGNGDGELGDVPTVVGLEGALELTATDGATEGVAADATGLLKGDTVATVGWDPDELLS